MLQAFLASPILDASPDRRQARTSSHEPSSRLHTSAGRHLPSFVKHVNDVLHDSQELPPLSANTTVLASRNLKYSYKIPPYGDDSPERTSTPFSDFFSESETGTPDFRSEESDSSSGSAFKRNTAEATKKLTHEWEQIERTLYDEVGEKSSRPQILEVCKQWRQLHPQLRVIGKSIQLPEKRICYRQMDHEEVIAMHYSDYEQFSESEERLSQSSTDVTPQNSPRIPINGDVLYEPKLSREKVSFKLNENMDLPDNFCSLLHITPIHIRSPSHKKRHNASILRSDLASSRWMRKRPESSIHCERNSAKSFVSLDPSNYIASDNNKLMNARVLTARHRELARLEPLYTNEVARTSNSVPQFNLRKVSLPPLLLEEEKRKVSIGSAKKMSRPKKTPKGNKDKAKKL